VEPPAQPPPLHLPRDLFDGPLDDLEQDDDARRAVIGAYRRLLEGLTACGLAARAGETALEHLDRALTTLALEPGALVELTDLFDEARYSGHPITAAHQHRAVAAFRRAREGLLPHRLVTVP